MTEHSQQYPSREATTTRWITTINEPLLPLGLRTQRELEMRRVCGDHPAWACIVLAGTIADLVLTLPGSDPWRRPLPGPDVTWGALLADGITLGTAASFIDRLDPPEDATSPFYYYPRDLHPVSAAILAAGAAGWAATAQAISAASKQPSPGPDRDGLPYPEAVIDRAPVYTYAVPALHWAIHRRRTYSYADDPWVTESLLRWTRRAGRILDGDEWDQKMVQVRVKAERLDDDSEA